MASKIPKAMIWTWSVVLLFVGGVLTRLWWSGVLKVSFPDPQKPWTPSVTFNKGNVHRKLQKDGDDEGGHAASDDDNDLGEKVPVGAEDKVTELKSDEESSESVGVPEHLLHQDEAEELFSDEVDAELEELLSSLRLNRIDGSDLKEVEEDESTEEEYDSDESGSADLDDECEEGACDEVSDEFDEDEDEYEEYDDSDEYDDFDEEDEEFDVAEERDEL